MSKQCCPLCGSEFADCKCNVGEVAKHTAKILSREFQKVTDQNARFEKALRTIAAAGCEYDRHDSCQANYPDKTTSPCGACRAAIVLEAEA